MADVGPLLVAATDDRQLARPDFHARLEEILAAGCPAVWLRSRALGGRDLLALARAVRTACDRHGAELWIGDRADIAALARADAVQLPERGLSIAGARLVAGPTMAVGRSVHSALAAAAAAQEGADRIVAGTIFPSASHPGREPAGLALLREIRAAPGESRPALYAIGGIDSGRVEAAVRAGADGIAVIGAIWDSRDPAAETRALLDALRRAVP
ncbi:MAG TPA: thiamine phosphate synthase [Gemmatimonadota bacterium]|nr:thiamine phosphate synthase [Gemmatimonadota bacterium]